MERRLAQDLRSARRIGIVDTGVNPWHSHVRGNVAGCRLYLGADGMVHEDADFSDPVGHGTVVAGLIREAFPDAAIFAVRVFGADEATYPSLVARGILRSAAEGCASPPRFHSAGSARFARGEKAPPRPGGTG